MKLIYTYIFILSAFVIPVAAQTVVIDSAVLQSGYINEIYYSIPSHTDFTATNDWDLAFSVQPSNPPNDVIPATTVRTNGGKGVLVYKITSTDTSGFNNVFMSNDSASWLQLFDSPTSWDFGALNTTLNISNVFDFGWGDYDMVTHDISSDSIYAVRTINGTWKKLWIKKLSYDTTWYVAIANFDNSNYTQFSINKQSAPGKNFVYVNLNNVSVMDKEPASWDLLFTRYIDLANPGPTHYKVTGVLMNKGVAAVKAYPVDTNTVTYSTYTGTLIPDINTIGYNWKYYVFGNNAYVIEDSLVYFIKATDNNIYKLRFLSYDNSDHTILFEIGDIITGVNDVDKSSNIILYPNPASDKLMLIDFDATVNSTYNIVNAIGQTVANGNLKSQTHSFDISTMSNGIYFMQIIKNKTVQTRSFVVNH